MKFDEIEKLARQIEAMLFRTSHNMTVGLFKSKYRGSGLSFLEHKVYTPGDDVRFIDWKVSTRQDKMYVKTFEEERNVKISVFLDLSNSMLLGWRGKSKIQAALEIVYLFFLITDRTKDYINLNLIMDKIHESSWDTGKKGLASALMFLTRKGVLESGGNVDQTIRHHAYVDKKAILKKIQYNLESKKEVLLISDFNEALLLEDVKKYLKHPKMLCVKMEAPVDHYDGNPLLVHGKTSVMNKVSSVLSNMQSKEKKSEYRNKHLRTVRMDEENYLEKFIKELV
jgi:uncharacterized protein (DUF58 family)